LKKEEESKINLKDTTMGVERSIYLLKNFYEQEGRGEKKQQILGFSLQI